MVILVYLLLWGDNNVCLVSGCRGINVIFIEIRLDFFVNSSYYYFIKYLKGFFERREDYIINEIDVGLNVSKFFISEKFYCLMIDEFKM